MSHVTGLIALVHAMVHCAGTLVVMPAFKASDFIDLAARQQITYSLIVPAMFNLCLLAPNFETADLSPWRVAGYGGAIMPEATIERIAEKLPKLKLLIATARPKPPRPRRSCLRNRRSRERNWSASPCPAETSW